MFYNWIFGEQKSEASNATAATSQSLDAGKESAQTLAQVDTCHLAALHLNSLLEYDFYDYTMLLLKSVGVEDTERLAFVDNEREKGLLIDGKRRGWFRHFVSFEGEPIVVDKSGVWHPELGEQFEHRQFSGWFYVEYDTESRLCEPLTYYGYMADIDDERIVRYYPSRNVLLVKDDADSFVSQVIVLGISQHAGDFCSIETDEYGDILSVVECLNGKYQRMAYRDGIVSHCSGESPRLCEQLGAPLDYDGHDFVDEEMLESS